MLTVSTVGCVDILCKCVNVCVPVLDIVCVFVSAQYFWHERTRVFVCVCMCICVYV